MFLLKLIIVSATLLKPLLLDMLLSSVGANMSSASAGPYGWAFLLALAATFQAVLVHFYFWQGVQNALAIRGSLIALIQQKILRMHSSVKSEYSAGVLLNLCSVDADNIMMFNWNSSQELWAAPITIVVSCVWLYMLLGVAALAGCALMLLAVAVSAGMI